MSNKIGIIGFGNHASRIISILKKFKNIEIYKIFHPTKIVLQNIGTNKFDAQDTISSVLEDHLVFILFLLFFFLKK